MIRGRYFSAWLALALPASAFAHSPIEGLDSLYNGLLHPVFIPDHLLLLIATGLYFGQQGVKSNLAGLLAYVLAIIAGLAASDWGASITLSPVLLASTAVIGGLVALAKPLGKYWGVIIGTIAGLLLGLDSSQETLSGSDKLVTLFGNGISLYLLMLYAMALADRFSREKWQQIAVRVIGSWIIASSFLVLALQFS